MLNYQINIDFSQYVNSYNGFYIVLEGIDGSGKSAQAEKLREYFESQGREVVLTREPRKRQGLLSELNHKILHSEVKIPPVSYQYIFTADRIMHHQDLIIPSLEAGKVVISDRSFWSAIPYSVRDWNQQDIASLTSQILVTQALPMFSLKQVAYPDLTFYLHVKTAVGIERVSRKVNEAKEIYETEENLSYAESGYEYLLKTFPEEFVVIDAERSLEEVTKNLVEYLDTYESTH